MAYTYRFLDQNNNIIYVGYTGQRLDKRIEQHFTKGHLDPSCYKSIARIEYIKYNTKSDAQIMETYYINKYKPIYNKQNKRYDSVTVQLEEQEWKLYKQFKNINTKIQNTGWWRVVAFFYLVFVILYYLMRL